MFDSKSNQQVKVKVNLDQLSDQLVNFQELELKERLINECSQSIINMLYVAIRSISLYEENNASLNHSYDRLVEAINVYSTETRTYPCLRIFHGNALFNGRMTKLGSSTYKNLRTVSRIFDHLNVDELNITGPVTRANVAALIRQIFTQLEHGVAQEQISVGHTIYLSKSQAHKEHQLLLSKEPRDQVLVWYAMATSYLRALYQQQATKTKQDFVGLKRLAQSLVEFPPSAHPMLFNIHLLCEDDSASALTQMTIEAACLISILFHNLNVDQNTRANLVLSALKMYSNLFSISDTALSLKVGAHDVIQLIDQAKNNQSLARLRAQSSRTNLDCGGVSEAFLHRLIIDYELLYHYDVNLSFAATSPSKAQKRSQLYPRGLSQGFNTKVIRAAFLYVLTRSFNEARPDEYLREMGVDSEVIEIFQQVFGPTPVGAPVYLSDERPAIVVQTIDGLVRRVLVMNLLDQESTQHSIIESVEVLKVEPEERFTLHPSFSPQLLRSMIFST